MGAVSRDLLIEQGTSWTAAWTVQLDGVNLNPAAGWQARAQVRADKNAALVLHEFACTVVGPVVQLTVAADDSSAWLWRRGVYDVEIFDNQTPPRVVRIVEGSVVVDAEVTRPTG